MKNITLTQEQQTAFTALMTFASGCNTHAMACLEGFAGTGKTTLVGALLNALSGSLLKVAVMAPTNKAVGVLQEKTGAPSGVAFGSLHSFLGLRMSDNEDGSASCIAQSESTLHEFDLAIVDECSMVSEYLFEIILRNKRQCRVLFVGDPAQLPPVSDGGVESPVFRMVGNKVRLNTIVRQALDNPIIAASLVVRQAIENGRRVEIGDLLAAFPKAPASAGAVTGGVESIIDILIAETMEGRQCRAIAWTNKAVDEINRRVHAAIFPTCASPFSEGEAVMAHSEFKSLRYGHTQSKRVFNSEELTVDSIEPTVNSDFPEIPSWTVHLLRDDGSAITACAAHDVQAVNRVSTALWADYRRLKANEEHQSAARVSARAWALKTAFAPLRHTYAMTAHKSQGSTFDTALVHWDDMHKQRSDQEFNRMMYVAMTRASKFMALCLK